MPKERPGRLAAADDAFQNRLGPFAPNPQRFFLILIKLVSLTLSPHHSISLCLGRTRQSSPKEHKTPGRAHPGWSPPWLATMRTARWACRRTRWAWSAPGDCASAPPACAACARTAQPPPPAAVTERAGHRPPVRHVNARAITDLWGFRLQPTAGAAAPSDMMESALDGLHDHGLWSWCAIRGKRVPALCTQSMQCIGTYTLPQPLALSSYYLGRREVWRGRALLACGHEGYGKHAWVRTSFSSWLETHRHAQRQRRRRGGGEAVWR